MRTKTGFLLFVAFLCLAASTAFADLNTFVGQWVNMDPNTRGITALNISLNGQQLRVQAWGKAHPSDIDWGVVPGYPYAASVSDNIVNAAWVVSSLYVTGFSETLLLIRSQGHDRLDVETLTRFTDNSQRANYNAFYSFKRNVVQPVPVSLPAPQLISPANGSVMNHYPRSTTVSWAAVQGAASYTVEVDYFDFSWVTTRGQTYIVAPNITNLNYSFSFVGAQPGRWRVWAVAPNGREGAKSPWWEFKYTR